jgi:hypothetical protein
MRYYAGCLLIFALFFTPAMAQTQEQQEADEIQALKLYVKIFASLETVEHLMRLERDNTRPSDWIENGTGLEGSGRYLRDAYKILFGLAKGMDQLPQYWVDRYEKFNKVRRGVRKAAAAIHGLAVLVDAVQNAETSTAEEKLRAMSQIIKDVTALVKVNPAVSRYIYVMRMAIEDIATNAAIIEAATRKKNKTIADVGKHPGGTDYSKRPLERNPLQEAIEAAEVRIEELEHRAVRRADEKAYKRIRAAEEACAKSLGTTLQEVSEKRRSLTVDKVALRRISEAEKQIEANIAVLALLIKDKEKQLIEAYSQKATKDADKFNAARLKVNRVKYDLRKYREEKQRISKEGPKQRKALQERHSRLLKKAKATGKKVARFNACVRKKLADEDIYVRAICAAYFPHYAGGTGKGLFNNSKQSSCIAPEGADPGKVYCVINKYLTHRTEDGYPRLVWIFENAKGGRPAKGTKVMVAVKFDFRNTRPEDVPPIPPPWMILGGYIEDNGELSYDLDGEEPDGVGRIVKIEKFDDSDLIYIGDGDTLVLPDVPNIRDQKRTVLKKEVLVPAGWAKGLLYNSNNGECSHKDKYLIFKSVNSIFLTLENGKKQGSVLVPPGRKLEVAIPSAKAHIRAFVSGSSTDLNAIEGRMIAFAWLGHMVDGWWFAAGCKAGTRPEKQCDNGRGQGGGCRCYSNPP